MCRSAPDNTASDIDKVVTQRKVAMAPDRIDRAWLYR